MESSLLERMGHALRAAFLPPMPISLRDPNIAALLNGTMPAAETVTVTEASALRYPSVWAAVQCIAGDVASLPLFHYRRRADGGKEHYTNSKLYPVLHDEFNPEMGAMVGRETMTAHVLLWGNAYAEIVRNDLGQVVALYPIEPSRVMPERSTPTGSIVYRVSKGDGTDVRIPAERILHIVGLGFNGLMGYSVIGMQRDSLGVGIAAERLGGQVMARGAKYSGFFEHPRTLGATAHKNLKESMATDLPGTYRILEEGMTYKPGSMPLRDAQFMEIRKFQVTEVARIFGIPPHKLGDLERATFSNIEEQNIDYVIGTLRRWLVRWEQECNRKLIPLLEKRQQFCEHNADALMRGKTLDRYEAHTRGITGGFLKINEARQYENLGPVPEGDALLIQGAMVPLKRLDDLVDKQVAPDPVPVAAPPAEPPTEEDEEARVARVIEKLMADLRAEFDRRTEAIPAAVVAALPPAPEPVPTPDPEFQAWREATFALIAGKLVRRELAQLRKREADPSAAAVKLEAFYRRFIGDALAELRPWLVRLPDVETRTEAVELVLSHWAEEAMHTCRTALATHELADVVRRWEIDRAAGLTRTLLEAIDG